MPDAPFGLTDTQAIVCLVFAVVGGLVLGKIYKPLAFVGALIVLGVAFVLTVTHI